MLASRAEMDKSAHNETVQRPVQTACDAKRLWHLPGVGRVRGDLGRLPRGGDAWLIMSERVSSAEWQRDKEDGIL